MMLLCSPLAADWQIKSSHKVCSMHDRKAEYAVYVDVTLSGPGASPHPSSDFSPASPNRTGHAQTIKCQIYLKDKGEVSVR